MAFSFFKKSKPEPEAQPAGSSHYRELTVQEVVRETRDAVSLVFAVPEKPLTYKPGQFLTLIFQIDEKEVRRAYSLCSSPHVDLNPAVAVKRVEKGQVSGLIVDTVKPGQRIRIMEPMGNFTTPFDPAAKRHLIMFAGGSGITPMMALIKSLLSQEPESICSLIYCNRDEHSIIFRAALDQLQVRFGGGGPVGCGSLPANPWGFHEMHGNISEWVEDARAPYATEGGTEEPARTAEVMARVLRGGDWDNYASNCRAATRDFHYGPEAAINIIGFRVARTSD